MHIRTFRAANLNSALAMIREQMGPDASILHTRQVAKGWVPWMQRNQIEVTAGLRHTSHIDSDGPQPTDMRQPAGSGVVGMGAPLGASEESGAPRYRQEEITRQAPDAGAYRLECTGPLRLTEGRCLKIALVGGCGVGKTTTIAKLAAGFRLAGDVRVGLLTLDSIRAAAREQIEAYARAMDVPLEIVFRHEDIPRAESLFSQCDVVFVDTPGHSSKSQRAIEAMGRLLGSIGIDQNHLVLDCNHSRQATQAYLQAFSGLDLSAVLLSKLDDVPEPDEVLSMVQEHSIAVSYLTTGQRVPQDICVAEQEMLRSLRSALAFLDERSVKLTTEAGNRGEAMGLDSRGSRNIPSTSKMPGAVTAAAIA